MIRSEDVVQNPFARIVFNHRNMLVSGRMVDRLHRICADDSFKSELIIDRANDWDDVIASRHPLRPCRHILEFLIDCIERVFTLFEKNQIARLKCDYLAAEFRSNRSSCTRDHDRLTSDLGLQKAGFR